MSTPDERSAAPPPQTLFLRVVCVPPPGPHLQPHGIVAGGDTDVVLSLDPCLALRPGWAALVFDRLLDASENARTVHLEGGVPEQRRRLGTLLQATRPGVTWDPAPAADSEATSPAAQFLPSEQGG